MNAIMALGAAALALAAVPLAPAAAAAAGQARPPAAARPGPIVPARLVGRWGDNGDCARFVVFRGDGTFRSFTGGEGSWRLVRDRLTMTGGSLSRVLVVRRLDPGTLVVLNPDGSVGTSRRC